MRKLVGCVGAFADVMRACGVEFLVCVTALVTAGCSRSSAPEYRPTATVREIMDSIVDPSADALWDSVEVVATLEGTVKKEPKTDEDWHALRRHAIALIEASNLLLMPNRLVAKPGEKAEDPRVDLHPEEIQTLIRQDPGTWNTVAHGLHDAAMQSLQATDAKDVTALLNAGDVLDQACESCHRRYWYRIQPSAAR